ncbi:hypothetical protein AB0V79_27020 [Mesorhizobium ciceri]|uniref:hypothetical protein n=1 Tax=Mesorhizobium ciceri TaxID=39645 RepID=UPI0007A94067|nr:hypothetical protein [Mesorhizobium ciceri]AMY00725.1 hypothetical protein A4R29_15395 [Mesorhizobium ciceri biovar biserrulae]
MAKDLDPEADMQKLTTRMVQLNRQFDELFERCFERPDLAYEKWVKSALNDAHSYELLKNHLFSLGEMPRDETRKENAIDASLRLPAIFQEYRGVRDQLDEMRTINPVHFDGKQREMRADPDPWWVKRRPESPGSEDREQERDISRQWLWDR